MVTLLKKRLRKREEEEEPRVVSPPPNADRERILLLAPVDGGFSFQLFAFPTAESVAAYVEHHFPFRADHLVVFRAAHEKPHTRNGASDPVETVVLVRDYERPGVVNLYSFVDMETANAFIRSEAMRGLPLQTVLLFWAEPVSLNGDVREYDGPATASPGPAADQWQQANEQAAPFQLQPIPPVELPPLQAAAPEPIVPEPILEMPDKAPRRGEPNPFLTPQSASSYPHPEATDDAPPVPLATFPSTPVAHVPPVAAVPPSASSPSVAPTIPASPVGPYDPLQKKARRGYVAGIAGAPAQPAAETETATHRSKAQEPLDGLVQRVRAWPGWDGFGPHIASAMRLRWQTYEDVRKDEHATGRAWLLTGTAVAAAALAAAGAGPVAFFANGLLAAIGAATFAGLIYIIGTLVFGGKINDSDFRLFLQRLGLAASPGFLLVLGAFPIYGPLFLLGALLWIMLTSIKATELSLELDRQSAAYTVIFAWLALFAVTAVLPAVVV
jgi:hypothetical protein